VRDDLQGTAAAQRARSGHALLFTATGIDNYLAERSGPWHPGANENFNGLIRQFFEGTDLSIHSHAHVAHIMDELITRPAQETARYRTPKQALHAENGLPRVAFKSLDRRPRQSELCYH
jgi:IS30 family transposase